MAQPRENDSLLVVLAEANDRMNRYISQIHQSISIKREPHVTNRHLVIAFGARFYDELMSGLPDVLMPTIQAQLGLSLTQVGLLRTLLDYVAAAVEPINGLLIDVWPRHWLMSFGALMLGLSIITIGIAPTFAILILGYVLFGFGSGPIAHTGDVVVVEAYPSAPDRAFARSTMIDTIGALLAPLLVTVFFWQGWPWHWLMIGIGLLGLAYSGFIFWNGLPPPHNKHADSQEPMLKAVSQNVREVLNDRVAMRWLLLLFLLSLMELPALLKTLWLAQEVGMSQALIGLYIMAEMAVGILGLVALDIWRQRTSTQQVMRIVTPLVAVLYPLWILAPGILARFVLMVPMVFFFSMLWPILRGNLLASVPGRAGSVTAVRSLLGLLPLAVGFGLLADQVGMTAAMLGVHTIAVMLLWWISQSPRPFDE